MKKTIVILILLLSSNIKAQVTHMLGFTVGVNKPLGKFAKQGDSSTGYALGGLAYTVNYDYVSHKNNFGGFFTFSNQSFDFDADNYTSTDDPDLTRSSYSGFRYNIKSINYGFLYIINKNSKVSFIPKVGAGTSFSRATSLDAKYLFSGNSITLNETVKASSAFNLNFGLDLTFRKSTESQLSYFVKMFWQTGSYEAEHTLTTKLNGQLFDKTQNTYNQSMGFYSYSIGARYILKHK